MTYPTGPSPEMPAQNPNWLSSPMPGSQMPYPPAAPNAQMPNSQMPYPPMATMAPPPPTASNPRMQRNMRLGGLVVGALVVLLIAFNTLPSAVAGGARAAYPNVHAVISGASDGQTIQIGQRVQLSAANSTGNSLTYLWNFSDNTTATTETVSHTFNQGGSTMISLTITDPLGETVANHSDTATINVSVQFPAPTAGFTQTNQGSDGNGNTIFVFDASGSTGNNIEGYSWQYGDGNTDFGIQVTHYFTSGATYTVTLTVTDADGQTGQTSHTISA